MVHEKIADVLSKVPEDPNAGIGRGEKQAKASSMQA